MLLFLLLESRRHLLWILMFLITESIGLMLVWRYYWHVNSLNIKPQSSFFDLTKVSVTWSILQLLVLSLNCIQGDSWRWRQLHCWMHSWVTGMFPFQIKIQSDVCSCWMLKSRMLHMLHPHVYCRSAVFMSRSKLGSPPSFLPPSSFDLEDNPT